MIYIRGALRDLQGVGPLGLLRHTKTCFPRDIISYCNSGTMFSRVL